MYVHTHWLPPAIFRAPVSEKLYIVPGWQEVVEGTTINDVKWIRPEIETSRIIKRIKSSKGDIIYDISKKGNDWSCTCPGSKYRNKICKHIRLVQSELLTH